ncbi:TPA: hypothetical protein ACJCIF_003662 [Salmonella enterica subsp. enterica]
MSENKSFSTAVPAVRIMDSGLNVPDEADILSGRLSDFSGALGGAMSTSLSSPQGQLASSESAIIAGKNDQLLYIVNQVNPDFSSGRFQDAIGKIYFLERRGATGTTVTATCNGTDGGLRARVASVVSAGRYYACVYKTDPENIDILGLTVSRDGSSWTTAVTFGIDEIPVLDVSNIGVKLQEA